MFTDAVALLADDALSPTVASAAHAAISARIRDLASRAGELAEQRVDLEGMF